MRYDATLQCTTCGQAAGCEVREVESGIDADGSETYGGCHIRRERVLGEEVKAWNYRGVPGIGTCELRLPLGYWSRGVDVFAAVVEDCI